MTVYIGEYRFACPPGCADQVGLREGVKVSHMTADDRIELRTFARDLKLPDERFMGHGTPRWRYIINLGEWYQARARGAVVLTVKEMYALEERRVRMAPRL